MEYLLFFSAEYEIIGFIFYVLFLNIIIYWIVYVSLTNTGSFHVFSSPKLAEYEVIDFIFNLMFLNIVSGSIVRKVNLTDTGSFHVFSSPKIF